MRSSVYVVDANRKQHSRAYRVISACEVHLDTESTLPQFMVDLLYSGVVVYCLYMPITRSAEYPAVAAQVR